VRAVGDRARSRPAARRRDQARPPGRRFPSTRASRRPVSRPRAVPGDEAHAGTANGFAAGSAPTWIATPNAARVAGAARTRPACRARRACRRRAATWTCRGAVPGRGHGSRRSRWCRRRTARAASRARAGMRRVEGGGRLVEEQAARPWQSACAMITRRASPPDSSSNRRAARCSMSHAAIAWCAAARSASLARPRPRWRA